MILFPVSKSFYKYILIQTEIGEYSNQTETRGSSNDVVAILNLDFLSFYGKVFDTAFRWSMQCIVILSKD